MTLILTKITFYTVTSIFLHKNTVTHIFHTLLKRPFSICCYPLGHRLIVSIGFQAHIDANPLIDIDI